MLDNRIQIYLNQDGSLKDSNIDPVYKLSNQTVIVELIAPFANTTALYVKFLLSNNAEAPVRTMKLMRTEPVDGEVWNVWQYRVPSSVLSAASKLKAQSFIVSFFAQELDFFTNPNFRFQGYFDTLLDLQIAIPQPSSSQPLDFAGVSGGLNAENSILYAGTGSGGAVFWQTQPSIENIGDLKTVQEFVDENEIENINRFRSTTQVKVAIAPSVGSNAGDIEIIDVTQTAIINTRLANVEGNVADIEANYVRQDLIGQYTQIGNLLDEDAFFTNYGPGTNPSYATLEQIKNFIQNGVEFVANKGQPNGYTPLDGAGKIDGQFLPDQLYFFRGTFGSVDSTTGGDLPSNPNLGDAYICDLPVFFSQEAQIEFFLQDKAIWDGNQWDKVPGFGLVPEAPVDGTMYGRQEGQWIDVLTKIGPYLFKRDVFITEPNTVTIPVGLTEFEPEDTVFVYEDGILLIEGINYSFDNQTGVINFLSSGQPGDPTFNIPDVGSIITIQLIKRSVFSGLITSASNISFDPQQINIISANNVQLAIQQLVQGVFTQEQLETPGQALVSGANVAGLTPQTSILDDLEAITWKGTLANVLALGNIVDPTNGDVYAILQEQTIYIRRNNTWAPILAQGQLPQDGLNGEDAVFGFLTQPASVLTQDANFDIVFTNSGSDIVVFEGNTQLAPQLGVTANPGEFNVILDQAINITAGSLTVPSGANFVRMGNHSQLADITAPALVRLRIEGRRNNGDNFIFFLNQSIALAPRIVGPAGADGVDGVDGVDGLDGTSVVIKGSVATVQDLDLIINPSIGDLYVVLADGQGYVYNGTTWDAIGQIQGPPGQNGTNGVDGIDGDDGFGFALINLYRRTTTNIPPSTPTNLSGDYDFFTKEVSNLSGNLQGFTLDIPQDPPTILTVTNSGASAYLINGSSNPSLTVVRGKTYTFNINASGHPFWIQTVPAPYDANNIYNDGITNNGVAVGTLTWTVDAQAPATLYYVCQFHSAMAGTINVIDEQRFLFNSAFTLSSRTSPLAFSGINPSAPRIIGVSGTDGQNGDAGPEGPQGPGIVFRGLWDATKTYFRTPTRADVVSAFTGSPATLNYYIALQQSLDVNPTNTSFWALFENQFDMVATNILLTGDATITRGLVIGQEGSNNGFIRSTTSSAINSGTGFFMNNQGELSLGSTSGNNGLYWNGTALDINGDIGGTIGVIQVGNITIDNNGITATDGAATPTTTFNIDATTGIGSFTGVVVAQSGTLGAATFGSTTLGGQGALDVSRVNVSQQLNAATLLVTGTSAQSDIRPRLDNAFDLGFADPQTDQYWRNILLRNNPIVVSDENKKENIAPVGNEYNDIILNTEIITYNHPGEDNLKIGIGARQFHQQFGEHGEVVLPMIKKGVYSADYVAFVPMMIKTIQAQEAKIQQLEDRLAALETNGEG